MGELGYSSLRHFPGSILLHVIVLHPRHKLTYFQTAQWSDEWIKTAEALVRDEFERSYNHTKNDLDLDIEIIDNAQAGCKSIKKSKACVPPTTLVSYSF
jgi:hypothetical protein